jgi:hypothetical protein
VITKLLSS